jgi:hypothetical protein
MRFNYTISGDTKACMTKTELMRAERACSKNDKIQQSVKAVDQKWLKDVLAVFAEKADLLEAQAIQLFRSGEFKYAQAMHARRAMKNSDDYSPRFKEYADMTNSNHVDMIKKHLVFALGVRHPDERVHHGASRGSDEIAIKKIETALHTDETKEAHRQRVEAALAVAAAKAVTKENLRELGASLGV